jgi:hypothetical protein
MVHSHPAVTALAREPVEKPGKGSTPRIAGTTIVVRAGDETWLKGIDLGNAPMVHAPQVECRSLRRVALLDCEARPVRFRPQNAFIQVGETVGTVEVWIGGEGGIRTLSGPVESVSYRSHIAAIAMNAANAAAPCT